MRNNSLAFLLAIILGPFWAHSQSLDNVVYPITIKGSSGVNEIYIAYHYGDKQYISDTLPLSEDGTAVLKKGEMEPGLYMIVIPPENNYVEFVVNEPKFSITIDRANGDRLKTTGSAENKIFTAYVDFIKEAGKEAGEIRATLPEGEKTNPQLTAIDEKVATEQQRIIDKHGATLVARMIKAGLTPFFPEAPSTMSEKEAELFNYYSYMRHYFDNIDMTTQHLLRTPIFHQKLMNYHTRLAVQNPDSIIQRLDYVLSLCDKNREVFKYTLISVLNHYSKSKLVCMDKVYVHLVDKYYLTGKATWAEGTDLERIRKRTDNMRHCICGAKAMDFTLPNRQGKKVSLYDLDAKLTVLVFIHADSYSSRKVLDKLVTMQRELPGSYRIVTVSFDGSAENWVNRMEKYKDLDWINLIAQDEEEKLIGLYDARPTPKTFLLDENKVILYKSIDVPTLKELIQENK